MEDNKMEYLLKKIDSCEDKNERLLLNTILIDVKKCKYYENEIDQLSVEAFKARPEEKYNIGCSIIIRKEEYTVKAITWCDTERSHIYSNQ